MPFSQQFLQVFFHQLRQSVNLGRAEPTAVLQADWAAPPFYIERLDDWGIGITA